MWSEWAEAFALGNAAILGNVCMLPLYPGLFALLAGRMEAEAGEVTGPDGAEAVHARPPRSVRWMGLLVLAGVLVAMIAVGAVLHLVNRAFADALPVILPVAYGIVALLGVAMILDRNPLAGIATGSVPLGRGPRMTAFTYGLVLGPLTLPCTGPLVLSAFVLGGVAGTGALLEGLAYFVFFGLGFGWPLVALPFLAAPFQQRITRFLARHHRIVGISSGALLLLVAAIGLWVDLRPNL